MTRINVVPAKELMDQHLLAEAREITRLPGNLQKTFTRKAGPLRSDEIASDYVLGTGHVKFFLNKFKWLERRFTELVEECESRGFTLSHKDANIFADVPAKYYNDWTPTNQAFCLNRQRISDRINEKPEFYRYRGKHVSNKE